MVSNQAMQRALQTDVLQAKLTMNQPGDVYEQEADRVADTVMRMPEPGAAASPAVSGAVPGMQRACSCGGSCDQCHGAGQSDDEHGKVQRKPAAPQISAVGSSPSATGMTAPPVVHEVLRSPGQPLDPATRAFFEPRFAQDFGRVRVHGGSAAIQSARHLHAKAYTVGDNIVLSMRQPELQTHEGHCLLAHELAHVIQQRNQPPHLARQPDKPELNFTVFGSVLDELDSPNPDFLQALNELKDLQISEMLATLNDVNNLGSLDQLLTFLQEIPSAFGLPRERLVGAIHLTKLLKLDPKSITPDELDAASEAISDLSEDDQNEALRFLREYPFTAMKVRPATEGLEAMLQGRSETPINPTLAVEPGVMGAGQGAGAPPPGTPPTIEPLPWPKNLTDYVGRFLGIDAHLAITAVYASEHMGQDTFYNFSPISAILTAWAAKGVGANTAALSKKQLSSRPDITNLTLRHLYEIKPASDQAGARAEANAYLAAFVTAGVPMSLGPTTEPGTQGAYPAPGGVYIFISPEPGVIIYRYRRGRLVPVPVAEPQTEEAGETKWTYELQPWQKAAVVATTGTAGMLLIIILLTPVGA